MRLATSNTGIRSGSGEPRARRRDGAFPEPTVGALAGNGASRERRTASLAELATRSAAALAESLDQLVALEDELRSVVTIVAARPWSEEERRRYRALAQQERAAHRRCVAARDWFDDVRVRLYEQSS